MQNKFLWHNFLMNWKCSNLLTTLMSKFNHFLELIQKSIELCNSVKHRKKTKKSNHLGLKRKFKKLSISKDKHWSPLEIYKRLRLNWDSWKVAKRQVSLLNKPNVINIQLSFHFEWINRKFFWATYWNDRWNNCQNKSEYIWSKKIPYNPL